jgi:hypothetical protein
MTDTIDITDLTALKAARNAVIAMRAAGLREVRYAANGVERSARYSTDIEAASALADLERRISDLEGRGLPRHLQVRATRGY